MLISYRQLSRLGMRAPVGRESQTTKGECSVKRIDTLRLIELDVEKFEAAEPKFYSSLVSFMGTAGVEICVVFYTRSKDLVLRFHAMHPDDRKKIAMEIGHAPDRVRVITGLGEGVEPSPVLASIVQVSSLLYEVHLS